MNNIKIILQLIDGNNDNNINDNNNNDSSKLIYQYKIMVMMVMKIMLKVGKKGWKNKQYLTKHPNYEETNLSNRQPKHHIN